MKMNVNVQFMVMFGVDMLNSMYQYTTSDTEYFRGVDHGNRATAWVAIENFCNCLRINVVSYMATIKAIKRHENRTGKRVFPTNPDVFLKALS